MASRATSFAGPTAATHRQAKAAAKLTFADRVEVAAVRALVRLPASAKRLIAGEPIRRDGLELELDVQLFVKLDARNPRPPLASRTLADAREDLRRKVCVVGGTPFQLASVSDTTIAGADGPLRARLFVPDEAKSGTSGPLILYYHGGGWVVGDLDTHDQPCRLLAKTSGARVLSVDYRRAPEHRFPTQVEDALASFHDAVARAEEFGADPTRIAVAGDSAGGHLSAVIAQQSASQGGAAPAFQLLVYPVTDLVDVAQSRRTFAEGFFLTKENMEWYEEQFLGPAGDRYDPRASPLRADDLRGVAPALVVTAGFDPLRDEGEAYADKLRQAGVPTALRRHPGYTHGFADGLAFPGPREAVAEIGGALRIALAR